MTTDYISTHAEALRLREDGWSLRQMANHFGVAPSTVSGWLNDPDGSKQRERRKRYQGTCEDCGAKTDGSNGPAAAPKFCIACTRKRARAPHGTSGSYRRGCSCDECRRAYREYMARYKLREPPSHGIASSYSNYGCRCDACREAWATSEWLRYDRKKQWRQRRKQALL